MNRRVRLLCRPHKDIDEMFAASIDQRRDVTFAKNIQPAANERKTFVHVVANWRNEIQFAIEPRFDGMLVGRSYVREMPCLQRADMCVDDFCGGHRASRFWPHGAEVWYGEPSNCGDQKD